MLLPLSVVNLAIAAVYRLFLYDTGFISSKGDAMITVGSAWDLWASHGLFNNYNNCFLGLFFFLLNDENKDASPENVPRQNIRTSGNAPTKTGEVKIWQCIHAQPNLEIYFGTHLRLH